MIGEEAIASHVNPPFSTTGRLSIVPDGLRYQRSLPWGLPRDLAFGVDLLIAIPSIISVNRRSRLSTLWGSFPGAKAWAIELENELIIFQIPYGEAFISRVTQMVQHAGPSSQRMSEAGDEPRVTLNPQ